MRGNNAYRAIRDYGIIGDGHTAALVSVDGSLDWLCLPRFDSPAVFCRLLDAPGGGCFRVGPAGTHEAARAYVGATNVLATTFTARDGKFRLTDFMPVHETGGDRTRRPRVLRLLEGLSGACEVDVRFAPVFDYARRKAVFTVRKGGVTARSSDGESLALSCPGAFAPVDSAVETRLRVAQGDRLWLSLDSAPDGDPSSFAASDAEADLTRTLRYWEHWSARCTYEGPYHKLVRRSALALKASDP